MLISDEFKVWIENFLLLLLWQELKEGRDVDLMDWWKGKRDGEYWRKLKKQKCGLLLSEIYGVGSCAEDLIYMGSLASYNSGYE